jgi:Cu(I)/Ag(I) efflux system membrane fusion protein
MKRLVLLVVVVLLTIAATVAAMRFLTPTGIEMATGSATKTFYQCAMHPQIVSDKPGVCPICQMRLEPIDEPAPSGARSDVGAKAERGKPLFYRHPMRPDITSQSPAKDEMGMDYIPVYQEDVGGGAAIPGHASFSLSAERQQLIGVKTDVVERRSLDVEVKTVGKVAYDPGLYQAFIEYREALRARGALKDAESREARDGSDALVRGAALKLRQQGISDAQIREMTANGRDPVNLLLPGKNVWIYAQVYEYEVELIHPGQEMMLTAPSLPGRTFRATVVSIDPIFNATTRTVRVRGLASTPDESLRPETFVHVSIHVPLGERVAVPENAVLDTGEHQIVFVVEDEGRFEPRAIKVGQEAQGFYDVLDGLQPGERVVTSANFLIDSESRFRAALSAFGGQKPASGHAH